MESILFESVSISFSNLAGGREGEEKNPEGERTLNETHPRDVLKGKKQKE